MALRSRILIFGATGACGRAVVSKALEFGHDATVFVRDPDKARALFDFAAPNLSMVLGEIDDLVQISSAIEGKDAAISCLSSFEPPHDQMSRLTDLIARVAQAQGRPDFRFIAYSLCGVGSDGDWLSHLIQGTLDVLSPSKFGPAISDHRRVIARLEASELDFTLFSDCDHDCQVAPLGVPQRLARSMSGGATMAPAGG